MYLRWGGPKTNDAMLPSFKSRVAVQIQRLSLLLDGTKHSRQPSRCYDRMEPSARRPRGKPQHVGPVLHVGRRPRPTSTCRSAVDGHVRHFGQGSSTRLTVIGGLG